MYKLFQRGLLGFILSSILFLFCSSTFAADAISTFPMPKDNSSKAAKLQIVWSEDGIKSIEMRDASNKKIQSLDVSGDWTNLGSISDHDRKNIIQSVDADFDGYTDLLVESSNGTAGQLFKLFRYNTKTNNLEQSTELDKIWNPTFDKNQKIVKGGANDMKPEFYVWQGRTLKAKR